MRRISIAAILCLLLPYLAISQDLYDLNKVGKITLEIDHPNWSNKLKALKSTGEGEERMIGKATLNGIVYDSVGIRFKGNSSFNSLKKTNSTKLPFNIKANFVKKKQRFAGKYKTLKLSNAFRDPSFLREVISYEIAGNYMPAPRSNFIEVYVNGDYIGLYNCTESIDGDFLETYYDEKDGPFFKCDPVKSAKTSSTCKIIDPYSTLEYISKDSSCYKKNYELKSDDGWKELVKLTNIIKSGDHAKINKALNVDQTLWMHAFNTVLVNLDSYSGGLCHNYYLYQDETGRWNPMVWDMNLSFGGFTFIEKGKKLSNEKLQRFSPFSHFNNPKRPLISQIFKKNNLNKLVYLAHVRTILEDYFYNDKYLERAKFVQQLIRDKVLRDENRLYAYESFNDNLHQSSQVGKSKIIGIKELMVPRIEYLKVHPKLSPTPPTIEAPTTDKGTDIVIINSRIQNATVAYLYHRKGSEGPFERVEMFDDGVHDDIASGDGLWGVNIPLKKGLEYYILAHNEDAAKLFPTNASFGTLKVK